MLRCHAGTPGCQAPNTAVSPRDAAGSRRNSRVSGAEHRGVTLEGAKEAVEHLGARKGEWRMLIECVAPDWRDKSFHIQHSTSFSIHHSPFFFLSSSLQRKRT